MGAGALSKAASSEEGKSHNTESSHLRAASGLAILAAREESNRFPGSSSEGIRARDSLKAASAVIVSLVWPRAINKRDLMFNARGM